MVFNSYEELLAAAKKRRAAVLTLEVDLGVEYSPEHEKAKQDYAEAKAMGQIFQGLGGKNLEQLEQRVAETKPEPNNIWIQYKKLDLGEWTALMKSGGMDPIGQYERVLPKVFVGVYGQDPAPDEADKPEDWEMPEPLTTDARSVSSLAEEECLLPGGSLGSVINTFIAWQNSGGDVNIRPTRSGLV